MRRSRIVATGLLAAGLVGVAVGPAMASEGSASGQPPIPTGTGYSSPGLSVRRTSAVGLGVQEVNLQPMAVAESGGQQCLRSAGSLEVKNGKAYVDGKVIALVIRAHGPVTVTVTVTVRNGRVMVGKAPEAWLPPLPARVKVKAGTPEPRMVCLARIHPGPGLALIHMTGAR